MLLTNLGSFTYINVGKKTMENDAINIFISNVYRVLFNGP